MTIFNPLRKLLLPALGGLAGLGLGCVITTGSKDCTECGAALCHSVQDGDVCKCEAGYQFENPDSNDFECEPIPGKGAGSCPDPNSSLIGDECFCDAGYTWCDPSDITNLTCCEDGNQAMTSGGTGDSGVADTGDTGVADTGTAGTGGTGDPMCSFDEGPDCGPPAVEPDANDCTVDNEGSVFCSNTAEMGPECSVYWTCTSGEWVVDTATPTDSCMFDGFDFAYGCVDNGETVEFICGLGPGTGCQGECSECVDDEVVQFCAYGKTSQDNCFTICTEIGDAEGVTYDFGQCLEGECACCDSGEEGCPV